MATSRTIPETWMYLDGNEKVQADDIIKTQRGWEKIHPNGLRELIHAFTSPGDLFEFMASVTNHTDGIYPAATALSFVAVFGVAVDVVETGGTPSINVYTDTGDVYELDYASGTGTTDLTFTGTPTGIEGGTLTIREEIQLNGGTIKDGNTIDVNNDFPVDYVQPDITVTDVASVTNHADATYDDTVVFSFTVVYSEAMDVVETGGVPSLQVYTESENPFDLVYVSGTGTTDLVFSNGNTATSTLDVVADVVTGVTITDAGSGYTTALDHGAAVTIPDPIGGGSAATATLNVVDDVVTGVTITDVGSGYTTAADDGEAVTIPDPSCVTGIADGSLVVIEDITLNGGTIKNAATSDAVSTFPTAYTQPSITMTT
jgi:hypothetical protein